jgi:hypothetical protein
MDNWSTIFTAITALTTTITAIFVARIGYLQWQTNKDKFRFELYDKRFKIYDNLRTILANISITGRIKNEDITKCISIVREGEFLFDEDVSKFLNEVYYKIKVLDSLVKHNENDEKILEINKWIANKFEQSEKDFEKYLRFK